MARRYAESEVIRIVAIATGIEKCRYLLQEIEKLKPKRDAKGKPYSCINGEPQIVESLEVFLAAYRELPTRLRKEIERIGRFDYTALEAMIL